MSEIYINIVLKDETTEDKMRIIWIDGQIAYYVNLKDKKSFPKKANIIELKERIENGELIRIKDPFTKLINEDLLSENEKQQRDIHYHIVSSIWNEKEDILFSKNKRVKLEAIAEENNISIDKLKRLLSRFWVRGMNKNALLRDYINSGGKGKDKKVATEKRGRPVNESSRAVGINIDNTVKGIIKKVYHQQYLTKNKKSYKNCYYYMLKEYFSDKIIIDEKEIYKIFSEDRIPTYKQFTYWCKKFKDDKNEFIKREGENKFLGNKREILNTSNEKVHGPGSVYQIDATIADVFLISEIFPDKIIGRPVVYAVIDVFSRLVVGIYAGLEGPSWIGAMMALDNVVQDKQEFCKAYGIDINKDDWPKSYLPEKIVADRGEFEGYNVHNLINNLHVQIQNTPPSRGDLKGIVERKFRTINTKIKQSNPGAVLKQYRERGDKPYWLDAKLTLHDFVKELIYLVNDHNKSIIEGYNRDRQMLKDGVLAVPVQLWNWGVINRRTALIDRQRDFVKLNLLHRDVATITRKGIRFLSKLFYSCSKAIEEQWFVKDIGSKIDFVYDPRNMNYIYIISEDGKDYVICNLTEGCNQYRDLSLYEFRFMVSLDRQQTEAYKYQQLGQKVELEQGINAIVTQAKKRYTESESSDRAKQLSIRSNREQEKKINRHKEVFKLDTTGIFENSQVIDLKTKSIHIDEKLQPKSKLNMLRKMRNEMQGE